MKTFLLLLISLSSYCQIHRFKAEYITASRYDSTTSKFKDWDEWQPCVSFIIYNTTDNNLHVYSPYGDQSYHIQEMLDNSKDDKQISMVLQATDHEGKGCFIEFVYLINNNKFQLYIRWAKLQISYQMVIL